MKKRPDFCKDCPHCKKKVEKIKSTMHANGKYTAIGAWDYFCCSFLPLNKEGLYKCSELSKCLKEEE